MKSFSNSVLAEFRASGCRISTFIKLEIPGGDTLYLSGRDEQLMDGTTVTGRVVGYPQIVSKVNWENSNIEDTGFTIELSNQPTGDSWQTLIEQFGEVDIRTIKASVIILVAGEQLTIFQGFIEQIDKYNEKTVTVSIRRGYSHVDTLIGNVMDDELWPGGIAEDHKGEMIPIVYGKIEDCPGLCFQKAATGELKYDITATQTTITISNEELNGDVYYAPGTIIIGEELVRYSSSSSQSNGTERVFSDCTRGYCHTTAVAHDAGTKTIRWQTMPGWAYVLNTYMFADHSVNSISDVRVNGKLVPTADYEIKLSQWWGGGQKAMVQFSRNPVYPDPTGATRTKKIYFTHGDNGYCTTDNILEGTEGDGPGGSGNTAARIPFISGLAGQELERIYISGRDWDLASKSLGQVKSAKLVIKSKVKYTDSENATALAQPHIPTAKIKLTKTNPTSSDYFNKSLELCNATGDLTTEIVYPRSSYGKTDTDPGWAESNPFTGNGWFSESSIQGAVGYTWIRAYADRRFGACYLVANFPDWTKYSTLECRAHTRYKVYQNPSSPHEDIGVLGLACASKANSDISQLAAQVLPDSHGYHTFNSQPLDDDEWPTITSLAFIIRNHNLFAYQHNLDIHELWLQYKYYPTDYGTTKTQEESLGKIDWEELDGIELRFYGWNSDSFNIDLLVYDAYIEVEYYPYHYFTKAEVTATVEGKTGPSYLTSDGEYPGAVARDIISNWITSKTSLSGISLNTSSFEEWSSENYVDYRIASRESVLSLLAKFAYENRRWLTFNDLVFKLIRRPDSWSTANWTITSSDIIRDSFSIVPGSALDLLSNLDYRAKYNHAERSWAVSESLSTSLDVGTKTSLLDLYSHCNSEDSTVPQCYLDTLSNPKDIYTFRVGLEGLKIEIGDVIDLTYSYLGISNAKVYVLSIGINLGNLMSGEVPSVEISGVV